MAITHTAVNETCYVQSTQNGVRLHTTFLLFNTEKKQFA